MSLIVTQETFRIWLYNRGLGERTIKEYLYYFNRFTYPKFNQESVGRFLVDVKGTPSGRGFITNYKTFLIKNHKELEIDDDDYSDIVEVEFTYHPVLIFLPPNNPAAVVEDYNDVLVTWELPGGAVEEISHHTGYAANGIGTGAAASFICAARFDDVELSSYYGGWSLTGVNIFLHSLDFSYVAIQVYEGGSYGDPGTLVYEEDVTSVAVAGEFTPHLLSTPVPLVAGNEYWIGYDISATTDHPAAVDAGPMVPGKGAWMYFNNVWDELINLNPTNPLDYNWVITGLVSQTDAISF